jgi:hypothetical protein
MYRDQLANYAEHFEREQMRIFLFRDFAEDTDRVVRRLFDFIRVDPEADVATGKTHNETSHLTNGGLYRAFYHVWGPIKSALPETAVERLFGLRSAVRELFFQSGGEEKKPSMKGADRRYLSEIYKQPNTRLKKWLESDLSHWT